MFTDNVNKMPIMYYNFIELFSCPVLKYRKDGYAIKLLMNILQSYNLFV